MRRKIIAPIVSALMIIGLSAGSAFAWTYGLTGNGECQGDGSFKITWSVSNSGESKPLVITSSNHTDVVAVGASIAAHSTATYTQTVAGTAAGDFTLSLSGNWPAPGGDTTIVNKSATVHLSQACGQPGRGGGEDEDKVTLCHATDSMTNPYVRITVDASGAYHGHYVEHQGPVFNGTVSKWGDIIPTFTFDEHSYSLNWDAAGQAIYNNNCQPVTGGRGGEETPPPVTTTTTTTPTGGMGGGTVVAAASTVAAAPQVSAPTGGVGAGEGGAPRVLSLGGLVGLTASLGSLGFGLRRLTKFEV